MFSHLKNLCLRKTAQASVPAFLNSWSVFTLFSWTGTKFQAGHVCVLASLASVNSSWVNVQEYCVSWCCNVFIFAGLIDCFFLCQRWYMPVLKVARNQLIFLLLVYWWLSCKLCFCLFYKYSFCHHNFLILKNIFEKCFVVSDTMCKSIRYNKE